MTQTIAKRVVILFFVAGVVGMFATGSRASATISSILELNSGAMNFASMEGLRPDASGAWQNPPQGPPQDDKKAEEVYKNIQIFKGLPASRIMGAMQFFARSLGVRCDHCHIQGQFDKDEKPTN